MDGLGVGADVSIEIVAGSEPRTRRQFRGIIPVFSKAERIFFLVYAACLAERRRLKFISFANNSRIHLRKKSPFMNHLLSSAHEILHCFTIVML